MNEWIQIGLAIYVIVVVMGSITIFATTYNSKTILKEIGKLIWWPLFAVIYIGAAVFYGLYDAVIWTINLRKK